MMLDLKRKKLIFKFTTFVTLIAFISLISGCVHIRVKRELKSKGNTGIVFKAYYKKKDFKEGRKPIDGVLSELYIFRNGHYELLKRTELGYWKLNDLIPGKYKLKVVKWINPEGEEKDVKGDNEKTFTLKAGEKAKIIVFLKKVPTGLIVILSVTIIVFIILAIYVASEEDVDVDISPWWEFNVELGTRLLYLWLPPPGVHIYFEIPAIEVSESGEPYPYYGERKQEVIPDIIDYYPIHNSKDIPPYSKIWVAFNVDMDPKYFDHRNFQVLDSSGKLILGSIYYNSKERKCYYWTLHPFKSGEEITVRLIGQALKSKKGRRMENNYEWKFRVREY